MFSSGRLQLRQNIQTYFNKDEIETICFDLGIDYDNLSGDTKESLVREMLLHTARKQQLDVLLEICRQRRPQVNWPEILPTEKILLEEMPEKLVTLSNEALEERRKQLILLEKVNNFWVKGVLDKSLPQDELVPINQIKDYEAIDHPWHEVVGTAVYDKESLTTETSIYDTFKEADQALLILGAPGSGKTTILINLARLLIALAQEDATRPIPVILNLASWGETRHPLADWVVEELAVKYQIPRKFGQAWMNDNDLLLLLDGLDQVPGQFRSRCVEAINKYRSDYGLAGLVVCSRSEAYKTLSTKLKFGGAVVLQQLTQEQIDDYLKTYGEETTILQNAIRQDEALLEMAQSPLMLNAMVQAYGHKDINLEPIPDDGDTRAAHHQHLFATYIERMFQRRGLEEEHFPREELTAGLRWLATQMTIHNQAVFHLEQIQPSWLSGKWWRRLYILISRLLDGIVITLVLGVYLSNTRGPSNVAAMFQRATDELYLPSFFDGLFSLILLNILSSIVAGLVSIFYFERVDTSNFNRQQTRWIHIGLVGLAVGLFTIVTLFPYSHILVVLSWGGVQAALFGLAVYFLHGYDWSNDIHPTEALGWTWGFALIAGAVGVVWGLFLRFLGQQVGFYVVDLPGALSWGLIFFLLAGLRGRKLETKNRPNEGMLLSGRNGLIAAVLFGIAFALFYQYALGVSNGLVGGLLLGLGPALIYGGGHLLNHFLVRILLNRESQVPLNLALFMDSAAERVFVYKVGGGYIFIHRLLQAFFSSETNSSELI